MPDEFTIVKDTREQHGYAFAGLSSKCEKLDTGDYSIAGLEDKICIERKSGTSELANNFGKDKRRFMNVVERMKKFPFRFIIIECSYEDILSFPVGSDIPKRKRKHLRITSKYLQKMLQEMWSVHHIPVVYCYNAEYAEKYVELLLGSLYDYYKAVLWNS